MSNFISLLHLKRQNNLARVWRNGKHWFHQNWPQVEGNANLSFYNFQNICGSFMGNRKFQNVLVVDNWRQEHDNALFSGVTVINNKTNVLNDCNIMFHSNLSVHLFESVTKLHFCSCTVHYCNLYKKD